MSLLAGRRPAPVTAMPVVVDNGWPDWTRLIVATAARTILATLGGLLIWAVLPAVIGWHSTSVMTGSMQPRLMIGDVAVSRPVRTAELRIGQVMLFDDPDHPGRLRMHRMVGTNDDGLLITRGDANHQDDSTPVRPDAVHGVGTLRVPLVGLPRVWMGDRNLSALAASSAALMVLIAAAVADRRLRRELRAGDEHGSVRTPDNHDHDHDRDDDDHHDHEDDHFDDHRSGGGRRRLVAGLLAGAGALTILLGGPADHDASAAFAATSRNGLNQLAAGYYRCTSAIAADRPDLWYKFDETSGTTAADSAGARPGTYSGLLGGVTLGTGAACKSDPGTSITLNGVSGMVTSNQSVDSGLSGTLEMWFKVSPGLTGGELMGLGDRTGAASGDVDRLLYISGTGRISFGVTAGTTKKTITSPASYSDGNWHHLAATFSGAGTVLYVDGAAVAADNSAVVTRQLNTYYLHVGYDAIGAWNGLLGGNYVAGSFDNVALYPTALTPAQVTAHAGAAG